MNKIFLLAFTLITVAFGGCSTEAKKKATPALFNSKAEAEKAAEAFNCTGAHKMGDKWMPCKNHGDSKHQHNH
ncbi:hypothetical protein [Prochlorococcus sp. MIT 1341]|uniref:hypothetical protein n=1 Tax=Prochlorococcus sp. MIT 1341 TaxID=3096221 RepID=UPI002A75745E|nr:hypothetical protein [Prochlorococcus sp. MIT 1341]